VMPTRWEAMVKARQAELCREAAHQRLARLARSWIGGDHPRPGRLAAAVGRYATLDPAAQDALTATLSRLLARMESMAAWQASQRRGQQHATALWHLRGAWHLDHLHRDVAGRGLQVADASRDAFMAESVLRLLADGPPDLRVAVASHNVHLQKTQVQGDGAFGHFPQGYHPAQALGDDYLAIAATSTGGRTAQIQPDPTHPEGFQIQDMAHTPATLTVGVGATVTWVWRDGAIAHDGNGDDFKSQVISQGTFSHRFTKPGTYQYLCTLHPNMTGTIEVTG
jgi:plastocyanin